MACPHCTPRRPVETRLRQLLANLDDTWTAAPRWRRRHLDHRSPTTPLSPHGGRNRMRLPTITGPTTATEAARLTAEAAVVIHATLPVALERMTAAAGTGYPSTASGADAGGRGSGPVASSTERHALNESTKADKASAALQRVYSGLGELAALSDEIARIVGPFFEGRLSVGEMEYIRRSVGKDVFCANPAHTTGVNRLPDRLHCRFCDDVRRNTGMLPDRKLLEIKATGTVRPENYDAFRARHRQTKVAKKGKGKAVAA